ncbi:MAG: methyltransferase domain-containing protein [Thermoplasmata archaeon]
MGFSKELLGKWDPMFSETVDPTRPRRTEVVLQALGARFRGPFRVLELGSGPGALTVRVLERFPRCRIVAVDTDPVLLRIGEQALRRFQKRLTWVLADLREKGWSSQLPVHGFDAAVSALTLHWLEKDEIRAVYREVGRLLRPEGVLVNADFLPSRLSRTSAAGPGRSGARPRRAERASPGVRRFRPRWVEWWEAVAREPSLRGVVEERQLRLPGTIPPRRTTGPRLPVSLEAHVRALRDAGFRETQVVWQDHGFHALVGLR